jgi:hypothetical protein
MRSESGPMESGPKFGWTTTLANRASHVEVRTRTAAHHPQASSSSPEDVLVTDLLLLIFVRAGRELAGAAHRLASHYGYSPHLSVPAGCFDRLGQSFPKGFLEGSAGLSFLGSVRLSVRPVQEAARSASRFARSLHPVALVEAAAQRQSTILLSELRLISEICVKASGLLLCCFQAD